MLNKILKNRIIAAVIIGTIVAIGVSIFVIAEVFQSLHLKFADTLYTRNEPSNEIIIIAIDDLSTQQEPQGLGRFSQWSRENYIKLLDILKEQSPKVITFDIIFNTYTKTISLDKFIEVKDELDATDSQKEKLEIHQKFIDKYTNPFKNPIDLSFAEKLNEFNNIVLAFRSIENQPVFPLKQFSENATLGYINTELDLDGILRKIRQTFHSSLDNKIYDDIAVATVKEYIGGLETTVEDITDNSFTIRSHKREIKVPLEENKMHVNYFADPFQYPMISFADVIFKRFEPEIFKDKIVLIGVTSLKDLDDKILTPKSNIVPMSGVEFRANEIQTILEEKFLTNQTKLSQILTIAGIAVVLTILFNYLGIALSILLAVFSIAGYIFAAHFFYKKGLILNMVYPFMAIILTYIASWIYKYFIADKKKREISSAFSHYVSDKLVEQISKNPEIVKLGGEKRVVTVFFSDIKNSTQISEKTEIISWVSQINEYFTVMESIIKKYDGTIDKYEGDAIMGFWNAPVPQENHVILAYTAALEMKKSLQLLHQKWEREGRPLLEFRIGINTGEAIVGNFGSTSRFDYTVMGDTVNTASRLESAANKTYGTSIITAGFENFSAASRKKAQIAISAQSAAESAAESKAESAAESKTEFKAESSASLLAKIVVRELDIVFLPGKTEPVKLFELVCLSEKITQDIKNLLKIYSSGLAAYRVKDFASAIQSFQSLHADPPSQIMLARCKKLQEGEKIPGLDEAMIFRILNK